MYFKMIAENVSRKALLATQKQFKHKRGTLRSVDYVGGRRVIVGFCESIDELVGAVSTLESDPDAFVLFVEDSKGNYINVRAEHQVMRSQGRSYITAIF